MLGSIRDLLPILLVVVFFELAVLKQPVPNITQMLIGLVFVVAGLTFFIFGLRIALFPIGEGLAHSLARKGSAFWLFAFAFVMFEFVLMWHIALVMRQINPQTNQLTSRRMSQLMSLLTNQPIIQRMIQR